MVKNLLLAIILSFSLIFFTGCWGSREPDELSFVLSMGLDKGREGIVQVSFQEAIPQDLGGEGDGEATTVIAIESASIFGALQLGNTFTTRELTLIHNRIIIISEELAKEGLEKYLNPLIRSREIRRNTFIAIARGSAYDFLKNNKPILEKYVSRQFELILKNIALDGFSVNSTLSEITQSIKSPGREAAIAILAVNKEEKDSTAQEERSNAEKALYEESYLAGEVPHQGGNKIDIIGLAAFRGDKLAGFLNGSETRYYHMVTGKLNSSIFTFADPEKPEEYMIVMKIKKGRNPAIKVDLSGEKPVIQTDLVLEGEIMSIQSGVNYELAEDAAELQTYLEETITREVTKVLKKTQEELQSDIVGFGDYTRQYFWTWQDWVDYNWPEKYPEAEIQVRTQLAVRRTGLMTRTENENIPGQERVR
ncbi:MAG: Ger(x)C family spore germination protein [Clostridia bacterium]|nr:Ger(x)C family spore germination protein [Clostridia bacterium]